MAEARRFEELEVWQAGRELTRAVYRMTRRESLKKDYSLSDQLRRAAASVMTNVAEGFERGSNKDFVKFLFIARGSAGEVRSLLYVARDEEYIDQAEFDQVTDLCVKSSRMIWALIKSLRGKGDWVTGIKIVFLSLGSHLGLFHP